MRLQAGTDRLPSVQRVLPCSCVTRKAHQATPAELVIMQNGTIADVDLGHALTSQLALPRGSPTLLHACFQLPRAATFVLQAHFRYKTGSGPLHGSGSAAVAQRQDGAGLFNKADHHGSRPQGP